MEVLTLTKVKTGQKRAVSSPIPVMAKVGVTTINMRKSTCMKCPLTKVRLFLSRANTPPALSKTATGVISESHTENRIAGIRKMAPSAFTDIISNPKAAVIYVIIMATTFTVSNRGYSLDAVFNAPVKLGVLTPASPPTSTAT